MTTGTRQMFGEKEDLDANFSESFNELSFDRSQLNRRRISVIFFAILLCAAAMLITFDSNSNKEWGTSVLLWTGSSLSNAGATESVPLFVIPDITAAEQGSAAADGAHQYLANHKLNDNFGSAQDVSVQPSQPPLFSISSGLLRAVHLGSADSEGSNRASAAPQAFDIGVNPSIAESIQPVGNTIVENPVPLADPQAFSPAAPPQAPYLWPTGDFSLPPVLGSEDSQGAVPLTEFSLPPPPPPPSPPPPSPNPLEITVNLPASVLRPAVRIWRASGATESQPTLPLWTYGSGPRGPAHWGELGYGTCAAGARQSPINIEAGVRAAPLPTLAWELSGDTGGGGGGGRDRAEAAAGPAAWFNGRAVEAAGLDGRMSLDGRWCAAAAAAAVAAAAAASRGISSSA